MENGPASSKALDAQATALRDAALGARSRVARGRRRLDRRDDHQNMVEAMTTIEIPGEKLALVLRSQTPKAVQRLMMRKTRCIAEKAKQTSIRAWEREERWSVMGKTAGAAEKLASTGRAELSAFCLSRCFCGRTHGRPPLRTASGGPRARWEARRRGS